ncbi:GNAT family acetyltransferase [Spirochaeta dissipatitropha]
MQIREFRIEDKDQVIQLWEDCGLTRPWNDPAADIDRKMQVQPELFLVGTLALDSRPMPGAKPESRLELPQAVVASVMAGYDGHRGWLHFVAVAPDEQGKGYARQIIREAENRMRAMGCLKVNLQVRSENQRVIEFYRSIGYSQDDVCGMGRRLEPAEQVYPPNRTKGSD